MTHSLDFAQVEQKAIWPETERELVRDLLGAGEWNTPLMLLSESAIGRNYQALAQALPRATIHYAVKSNNNPLLLREVLNQGGSFEVCSLGEVKQAIALGVRAEQLIHTHPIKAIDEFDAAVGLGVRTFVVDNPDEVTKLTRYQDRRLRILIRYRIKNISRALVDLQYKFGCTTDSVLPLARLINEAGHEFYGLCSHVGSQCVHSDNHVKTIEVGAELIATLGQAGFRTRLFDIGGGFPVEYVDPVPAIDDFCRPMAKALNELIEADIEIICEPGRYISASAVTLVCSVIGKAERDGKIWYYLDDGLYSTFSGILYDQCQYPVITNKPGPYHLSVLAGPTCDSFDIMYDGLMVPKLELSDRLIFPRTGAYCAVSGSNFNSLPRPEYRLVK